MSNDTPPLKTRTAEEAATLDKRFTDLAAQWKRERGPHSSSARLAEHPAYQQIIDLGPEVVPLLLRELDHQPDHWFRALQALTGVNPVPAESRGNLKAMAAAWLAWGREQGLQSFKKINDLSRRPVP